MGLYMGKGKGGGQGRRAGEEGRGGGHGGGQRRRAGEAGEGRGRGQGRRAGRRAGRGGGQGRRAGRGGERRGEGRGMFLFFFCPPYSGVTIIICFCCTPTTQSHVLRIGQGREGTPPPQEHYYYFRVLLKEEKVWGSGKGGKGTPTHRSIITIFVFS